MTHKKINNAFSDFSFSKIIGIIIQLVNLSTMDLEEKRKEKCDKINLLDALRKGKRCDQRIG